MMRCQTCGRDHATYLHEVYAGTLPESGPPVLGVHRLPARERWSSPLSVSYVTSDALWRGFIRNAAPLGLTLTDAGEVVRLDDPRAVR